MTGEIAIEFTTKLNGVILKKAELDNDFEKIYSKVFEKIIFDEVDEQKILEIFGETSG